MKTLFSIMGVVMFMTGLLAGTTENPTPGSIRLDAEFISSAGIVRHSDLLAAIHQWDSYTVDGHTWFTQAGDLSLPGQSCWTVYVDGIELDLAFFDVLSLNRIPLNLQDVAYVDFTGVPDMVNGEFEDCGMLSYHTKPAGNRESFSGDFNIGNETGDPGPYRYTEYKSINVDKIGPDMSAGVVVPAKKWVVRSGAGFRQYFPTDEHIVARVRRASLDHPKTKNMILNASVTSNPDTDSSTSWILAAFYSLDEDYVFHKSAGTELPYTYEYLLLNTRLRLGDFFTGEIRYSRKEMTEFENLLQLDPQFMLEKSSLLLEYTQTVGSFQFTNSLRWWMETAESDNGFGSRGYTGGSFATSMHNRLSEQLGQQLNLGIDFREGESVINAQWQMEFQGQGNRLWLQLHSGAIHPLRDNSTLYWQIQGYQIAEEFPSYPIVGDQPGKSKKSTADMVWNHQGNFWQFVLHLKFRKFADHEFIWQTYTYLSESNGFNVVNSVAGDMNASIAGADLDIYTQWSAYFQQSLSLSWGKMFDGDSRVNRSYRQNPEFSAAASASYKKPGQYSIRLSIRFRDQQYWRAFQGIEADSQLFYSETIPAYWSTDVSMGKTLWQGRLHGMIVIRNLLNESIHSHPIGSYQHMSFFVKISASLP